MSSKSGGNKKRLPHRLLSNSTWQHPSTLLGHTSSAYTPNPGSAPSDNSADSFDRLLPSEYDDDVASYDPAVSDTDGADFGEATAIPTPPRNLSIGVVGSRFVALRWQEPENIGNNEVSNYIIYYKQEKTER